MFQTSRCLPPVQGSARVEAGRSRAAARSPQFSTRPVHQRRALYACSVSRQYADSVIQATPCLALHWSKLLDGPWARSQLDKYITISVHPAELLDLSPALGVLLADRCRSLSEALRTDRAFRQAHRQIRYLE